MTYHSEYGQDRWLHEHVFGDRRDGTFVEAGALDGLLHSNTLFFERELGWTGVLIEANPLVLPALRVNRPLSCVVGWGLSDKIGSVDFCAVTGPWYGWSAVNEDMDESASRRLKQLPAWSKGTFNVLTMPLIVALRDKVSAVDYLSLDIEGGELRVLKDYPFDEIPIEVIGVEDNDANNHELAELLIQKGYKHLARVGVDEMWRRSAD